MSKILERYININGDDILVVSDYNDTVIHYKNRKLHRENGPAVIYKNPKYKEYWYEGKKTDCNSQEDFERIINLQLFW